MLCPKQPSKLSYTRCNINGIYIRKDMLQTTNRNNFYYEMNPEIGKKKSAVPYILSRGVGKNDTSIFTFREFLSEFTNI